MLGIKKEGGVFVFFYVPVTIRVFKRFLDFIVEGMGSAKFFPNVYGVEHDMGKSMSTHGFRAEVEAETRVECGSF